MLLTVQGEGRPFGLSTVPGYLYRGPRTSELDGMRVNLFQLTIVTQEDPPDVTRSCVDRTFLGHLIGALDEVISKELLDE